MSATVAPRAASSRTVARPTPPLAPVTTTILPARAIGPSFRSEHLAALPLAGHLMPLGRVDEDVWSHREMVGQPPVDVLGEVLCPVGADVVAEGDPRGDDQ